MKIRRVEDIVDFLDESSQRRKRELISIHGTIGASRSHELSLACRTAVVMSYAHWEGFVKDAALSYVHYVDALSLPLGHLIVNFQALACKGIVSVARGATKRIGPHVDVVALLVDQLAQQVPFDLSSSVDTESNLNWEVFENICLSIGIDPAPRWSTYNGFMNDLFALRCQVAHGALAPVTTTHAIEVLDQVSQFLDWFRTDVENAASMQSFRRAITK